VTGALWDETCAEEVPAAALDGDTQADLAVIGGGFTGCAAALAAAEAGARVVLLEAERVGHGGSGRNVGLVNAGLWLPPETILAQLGEGPGGRLLDRLAAAPDAVFDRIARHGIACAPVRAGTLHLAHAPSGLADLRARHRQQNRLGAPVRLLAAAEAVARSGAESVHGALFDPRAGTIQPMGYVRGLARAAAEAGARVVERSPVRAIRAEGGGWRVEAPGGVVRAGALLLATNAYHRGAAGVAPPRAVPVHYVQVATAPLPPAARARILPGGEGCWDTALVMSSFRLDPAGRLVLGGMGDGTGPAGGIHLAWARRKIAALFPGLAMPEITHVWTGRIAMTGDHLPRIVRLGPLGLSIHGYSGRGIGPGTVFGAAAAQALLAGDEGALPLPPVDGHTEPAVGLRAAWVEAGAALTHALAARRPAGASHRRLRRVRGQAKPEWPTGRQGP